MKTMSRMLAATAALGLVFAPIAAQANTRAGDSQSVYSVANPGLGREDDGESIGQAFAIVLAVIAVSATVYGISEAASSDEDDDDQSPGT